jgi:hypothetical protein
MRTTTIEDEREAVILAARRRTADIARTRRAESAIHKDVGKLRERQRKLKDAMKRLNIAPKQPLPL